MIKRDLTYVDFNDVTQTETFWFHLSKSRLTDHMDTLKVQLETVKNLLEGPKKELTITEAVQILDLIKTMVRHAYGVRSEDGKRFRQSDEVWQDFKDSAAYDQLLTEFMEKPEEGMAFIQAVMPQDLVQQAQEMLPFADGNQPTAVGTDVVAQPKAFPEAKDNDPLKHISREDLEAVLARIKADEASPRTA
jgi:hypothetical protein